MLRVVLAACLISLAAVAAIRGPDELANAPVRWLLRSPLHGMISSQVLLLELTSREGGDAYAIPLNYVARSEGRLLVGSDFSWWRDLEAEPRVHAELRNNSPRAGSARIVRDPSEAEAGWRALRPRSWEDALEKRAVLIEITLDAEAAP